MTTYPALLKREFLDHRGAMLWTPAVIAALLCIAIIWGSLFASNKLPGQFIQWDNAAGELSTPDGTITKPDGSTVTKTTRTLEDGRREIDVTVKDRSGKQLSHFTLNTGPKDDGVEANGKTIASPSEGIQQLNAMDAGERDRGARLVSVGIFSGGAGIPLLVAVIMIPFILLSSLYDERQDRSILFWKSLPVADRDVVLSKLLGGTLITLASALAAGVFVHLVGMTSASLLGSRFGVHGAASIWHLPTIVSTWALWGAMALQFVLFAAPVYAWFLLISAAAPRAPFLLAFMIPGAIALFEAMSRGMGYGHLGISEEFFGRLIGAPLWEALQKVSISSNSPKDAGALLAHGWQALGSNVTQPGLWIGLAVAAGLIYATVEVRRRKSL